jgi:hypothetical protein
MVGAGVFKILEFVLIFDFMLLMHVPTNTVSYGTVTLQLCMVDLRARNQSSIQFLWRGPLYMTRVA